MSFSDEEAIAKDGKALAVAQRIASFWKRKAVAFDASLQDITAEEAFQSQKAWEDFEQVIIKHEAATCGLTGEVGGCISMNSLQELPTHTSSPHKQCQNKSASGDSVLR